MPKASELKKGTVVEINQQPYVAKQIEVKTPSSRGTQTLYKVTFNNLQTKQKWEQTYTSDDILKDIQLSKRPVQFLYRENNLLTFMDKEDYSQYTLATEDLSEQLPYLTDSMEGLIALIIDGQIIGIELPTSVTLTITETTPALKGASATNRTKPATLTTGLVVQVPEYLATGESIRINTETGKFMSRA